MKIGAEHIEEERRGARWMEDFWQDLRFTARSLRKSPSFTVFALLVIALGIGANTAVFSVLDGLLLRPLPFAQPNKLVWITNADGTGPSGTTSQSFTYRDLRARSQLFADMAAYNAFFPYFTYNLTGNGQPERLTGIDVTGNFFHLLGIKPQLGRLFAPEECIRTGRKAAILSNGFWKAKFAANPAIIGQKLIINGEPVVVVGVLPASFDFGSVFSPGAHIQIFVPRYIDAGTNSDGNEVAIIGRLKPGVSLGSARSELTSLIAQISKERGYPIRAHAAWLRDYVTGGLRSSMVLLSCAVIFVLLIAVANLSNLLLARATGRRKELALRLAVGASRGRIVRQMLTESAALSLFGGLLALPVAFWGTRILANLRSTSIPLLGRIGLDARAFLFTLALAVLTGVLFGLAPAFHASSSRGLNDALKEGTSGAGGGAARSKTRNLLVISEVALSLMLLGMAGLAVKSLARLLNSDLGFQPDHVAIVRVDPGPQMRDPKQLDPFLQSVLAAVRAVPGIKAAGYGDALPLDRDRSWGVGVVGKNYAPMEFPEAFVRVISPGYFSAMRIPLIAGRVFDEHDTAESGHVVIVNETMARALFPGENPLGRELTVDSKSRIVGVVHDVKHSALDEGAGSEMYLPYTQSDLESADLVVRSNLPPDAIASTLRRATWEVAPNQPLTQFRTMDEIVDHAASARRFTMWLLAVFAGLALVLAATGIYGVIAYSVGQRTREIGIRMALGADMRRVELEVIRDALRLSVIGVAIGVAGLIVAARLASSMLYQVSANDPVTLSAVAALLIATAIAAAYFPARRAARINPVTALRAE